MKNKFFLILEYYKKLCPLIFTFSIVSLLFMMFSVFLFVFLFFSFFISILIFEVSNKKDYVFYFNNGVTKPQLWAFSLLINASILIILLLIWKIIF